MVIRQTNPENKFSDAPEATLKTLDERVKFLEERVHRLEVNEEEDGDNDTGATDSGIHVRFGSYELYGEWFTPDGVVQTARQIGAPASITRDAFGLRRDLMVAFIEGFWPEWELVIVANYETPDALMGGLMETFPARDGDQTFQRLIRNVDVLWKYLQAEIVPVPRNLAYAMAGVPELTPRSSVDRCAASREPSKLPIYFRAMKDHMRRKHPQWYRSLIRAGVTAKTLKGIPRECGECARFVGREDRIAAALEVGDATEELLRKRASYAGTVAVSSDAESTSEG